MGERRTFEIPDQPEGVRCCYCGEPVPLDDTWRHKPGELFEDTVAKLDMMKDMLEDGLELECGGCRGKDGRIKPEFRRTT